MKKSMFYPWIDQKLIFLQWTFCLPLKIFGHYCLQTSSTFVLVYLLVICVN